MSSAAYRTQGEHLPKAAEKDDRIQYCIDTTTQRNHPEVIRNHPEASRNVPESGRNHPEVSSQSVSPEPEPVVPRASKVLD